MLTATIKRLALGAFLAFAATWATSDALDVGYAGVAYAGNFDSIQDRFPFTSQIIPPRTNVDGNRAGEAEAQLLERVQKSTSKNFNLVIDSLSTLAGHEQAIMVALVLTGETVSTERIGDFTKLFINLRAQTLFFDFKSMTVLRAYPISVVYLGAFPINPSAADELAHIRELLLGGNKPGIVGHFVERLTSAALPGPATHSIGVVEVSLSPEVTGSLPAYLAKNEVAQSWLADNFSEALTDKTGVALLPYSQGYAIGNTMATRFADGTVFNLKIPPSDYSISLDLQSLKKIKFADVPAGTSFVYGAFVHVLVQEPVGQHRYLDAVFKNGETKTVPAHQTEVDDWPAYQDAIEGLFQKFSTALSTTDTQWLKSSVTSIDVTPQIAATKTVLKSCH